MKIAKNLFAANLLLMGLLLALGHSAYAQDRVGGKPTETILWNGKQITVIEGEIALKLAEGPGRSAALDSVAARNADIVRPLDKLGWMTGRIPAGDSLEAALDDYQKLSGVLYAEPNGITRITTLIPDDLDGRQWALNNTGQAPANGTADADVDAPEAWGVTTGSQDVIIAILDSGIPMQNGQLSHPDLDDPNKMILGPDFIEDPNDPNSDLTVRDNNGHGTHVAGIAGAESNNATGIAGVCWNCRLMIIQTQDANGFGTVNSFYNGVIWAVDNTPSVDLLVINASLGSELDSQRYIDAIEYAQNNNVLIVAAAGNENGGAVLYPAAHATNYHNLMAVSSTDHNDVFSSFSSSGPQVTLSAPGGFGSELDGTVVRWNGGAVAGTNIFSTTPNYPFTLQFDPAGPGDPFTSDITQDYGYLSGTSMAAPHVAGAAALKLAADPSLTPTALKNGLQLTADKVPGMNGAYRTDEYGRGRLNIYEAVRPLDVYITGPSQVNADQSYTWTANASGGTPSYTYFWYWRSELTYPDWNFWSSTQLPDFNFTFHSYMVPSGWSTAWLRVVVHHQGSGTEEAIYRVIVNNPSGAMAANSTMTAQMELQQEIPDRFDVLAPYPNPFNPSTNISYMLPEQAKVRLEVYNILGRRVATLVNGSQSANFYEVRFDGQGLASGLYIARLQATGQSGQQFVKELKMQMIK